jgi:hypothetical protein
VPGDGLALAAFHHPEKETGNCEHDKYEKQYFGDANGPGGDPAEAEHGSDQCNDKKDNGVVQHIGLLVGGWDIHETHQTALNDCAAAR